MDGWMQAGQHEAGRAIEAGKPHSVHPTAHAAQTGSVDPGTEPMPTLSQSSGERRARTSSPVYKGTGPCSRHLQRA